MQAQYANGQRIAMANSYDVRIHTHGTFDASDEAAVWTLPLSGYVVKSGDRICWRQTESEPGGGLGVNFTNGTSNAWVAHDQDGNLTNIDNAAWGWHNRCVDLSPDAGLTVAGVWIGANDAAPGTWDMLFGDIAIFGTDGTATPLYWRDKSVGLSSVWTNKAGPTDLQAYVETTNASLDMMQPDATTTYYQGDQLGSARMLTAAGGWPLSSNTFYPFGQEAALSSSVNHYKFTGKERDTESGLDYFGARYLSSSMGRFMSPDPFLNSGRPDNPQTWNRYSYGLNNPLRNTDPTGLYTCSGDKSQCSGVADALKAAQGALGNLKKGSAEYNALSSAISAYGKAGVDNGVHVGFGATSGAASTTVGVLADASGNKITTADNPTGQNINVTVDPSKNGSMNQEAINLAHEGSHVADGSALVGALPMNLSGSDAVLGGPLNMTSYQTEMKAYGVSSYTAQGLGLGSLSVGNGNVIWNASWGAVDRQTLRTQGIQHELADPKGLYNVTPDNQGHKLIQ